MNLITKLFKSSFYCRRNNSRIMSVGIIVFGIAISMIKCYPSTLEWHLAMNLNPEDGHIMDYYTGWQEDSFIASEINAFHRDYKNKYVWKERVIYIAIVRHHNGIVDAVKVWKFNFKYIAIVRHHNGIVDAVKVWKFKYIAIVRHHNGITDAVKVWKFKYCGLSLLQSVEV